MAKSSGLGQLLLVGGYNLSGDVGVVDGAESPRPVQEVPGMDVSAMERLMLLGDGRFSFKAYFNKAAARAGGNRA